MTLTHGSLFTGIGAFDLGFEAACIETRWQSEIDRYCNRVLKHHWPKGNNLGDIERISKPEPVDVISFGSPCQDLSVAGQQAGLAGSRSGLFFEAARIINECHPTFAVWENVPGAFSSNTGRDFGIVLYSLEKLGASDIAWRVVDSQYAGVPQQRRRIYLVADFRGQRAGEILFDAESCGGHPSPFCEERQELAATLAAGARGSGRPGGSHDTDLTIAPTVHQHKGDRGDTRPALVVETSHALTSSQQRLDGTVETFVIQDARNVAHKGQNGDGWRESDVAYTLDVMSQQAVFQQSSQKGRGTIGYRANGQTRPVKTQPDGQFVFTQNQRNGGKDTREAGSSPGLARK